MIESLTIRGFKCFSHLELSSLSRVTIVGGRNNAGKTALLEALFMFLDRADPNVIVKQFARRGVPALPLTADAIFAPVFASYNMAKPVQMTVRIDGVEETMMIAYAPVARSSSVPGRPASNGQGPLVVPTTGEAHPTASLHISYGSSAGRDDATELVVERDALRLQIARLSGGWPPASMVTAVAPPDPNEIAAMYGRMDVEGTHEIVLHTLQLVEPRLRSLTSVQTGTLSLIHGDIGLERKVPVAYMGAGMARLLAIIVFIGAFAGGIVLIDEIENGLHHAVASHVCRAIGEAARQFGVQVIATTHSYEFLTAAVEGFRGELAGDLSYVRLNRKDEGTTATIYDASLLQGALASELEVR